MWSRISFVNWSDQKVNKNKNSSAFQTELAATLPLEKRSIQTSFAEVFYKQVLVLKVVGSSPTLYGGLIKRPGYVAIDPSTWLSQPNLNITLITGLT